MRRVAQEHIDAALTAVFGDSKQITGREPSDDSQEGESAHRRVHRVERMLQGTLWPKAACADLLLKSDPGLLVGKCWTWGLAIIC